MLILIAGLSACAGPNGRVSGGMAGSSGSASAHTNVFKIPLP